MMHTCRMANVASMVNLRIAKVVPTCCTRVYLPECLPMVYTCL